MSVDMKTAIAETFTKMLEKKSIDKITVKDLVNTCGISRQTFYYHFQDMMDVVEWSMEQVTRETLRLSLEAEGPEEALKIFILKALEHRHLIQRLLQSRRREQMEGMAAQAVRTYLTEMFQRKGGETSFTYSEMELILDIYSYGIAGLLMANTDKDRIEVETMAHRLHEILFVKMKVFSSTAN